MLYIPNFQAKQQSWAQNVVMGLFSAGVGFGVLLLPETSRYPLPQSMQDIYIMNHKVYKGSKTTDIHCKDSEIENNGNNELTQNGKC